MKNDNIIFKVGDLIKGEIDSGNVYFAIIIRVNKFRLDQISYECCIFEKTRNYNKLYFLSDSLFALASKVLSK